MGIKVIDRPGENQDREVERIGDRGRCGLRNGVHPRFYPDAKEPGGVRPYPALFTFVKMADSPNSLPESPTSWPTLAIPCRQWGGGEGSLHRNDRCMYGSVVDSSVLEWGRVHV